MILPLRRAIMCGATWRTIRYGPRTLIAMTRSHSLGVPLVEISRLQRRIERGVVHQHVDLAEALDGLRHQALHRFLVADVEFHARDGIRAVAAGDFLGELAAVGDVGDHHARAFGGERLRIMPADALGAAGDDRGFSGKPRHDYSPVSPRYARACHERHSSKIVTLLQRWLAGQALLASSRPDPRRAGHDQGG